MQKELKQVQEIYPEATGEELSRESFVINFGSIEIYHRKPENDFAIQIKKRGLYLHCICLSKDFKKILEVLKSIKLCEG